MPIIRYQIRNEYGLADPELYGAADKEDPEALLEGVAMAGLVGVLRQLGDLAEFAAEIFHSLHEEVMATAARGHTLMLRVQQLEVDFPEMERVFLSQTSHSQLSYNAGMDWHPNLQIDQNLITREDIPRFILDSYEESRGPPRLFMLDKFDIAGDGACLKRYSDPSFFKMDFAASGKMEPDVQREKKPRKNKKKVLRWRNGETPESHITPHVNSRLEHVATEKAPENPPIKRAKLKTRQLNDNTSIRRSYMEHVVRGLSSEHMDLSENSIVHSCIKTKTVNSTEVAPVVREVVMDTSINRPFFRERNRTKLYNKEEVILAQKEETVSDLKDGQNEKKGLLQKASGEVERLPPTFNKAGQKELFDADCKREANDGAESRTSGSLDGYRSDDAASELDNYLDALTTMDSEIETDNETKGKLAPSFFGKKHSKMDSNIDEERRLLDECLGSHKSRQSSQNSLSNKRISSPPNEASLNSLADSTPSDGTSSALPGMFTDPATPANEARNINFQNKANSELLQKDASIDLITLGESGIESTSSCIANITAAKTSLDASPEDKPSATANQSTSPSHSDITEKSSICFDGAYNPPVNSDDLSAVEGTNVMLSNPVDGHEEVDKLLEDYFHPIKVPSTTENDYANPGLISKNNENCSDTSLQSWDESDSNLQVQDDPLLETQMAVQRAEEPRADSVEGIISMPSVSDSPQIIKATDLEIPSSICIEDSSLPFKEDLHGSVCQGPEVDSEESTLPGKCAPIFPLDNSSSSFVPGDSLGPVDNSVMSDEKSECARSLTSHEDGADSAEDEVTSAQNTGDFAEMEVTASGISLPEPFIDNKVPQESCNLDQAEFILKGEMVPQEFCNLDQVEFTQNGELVLQESRKLDEVEFTQKGELPNNLKVLPKVSNCETRDSPSSTEDCLNLLIGKIPFTSPVDLLPAECSSPHSVIEFTETNELFCATMHSKESSSNTTNLQEYSISSDSILEKQKLEVTEAACPKDLIGLDLQQVPGTVASQKEYNVVTGPQDSVAAGHILDLSSQPDFGEHNHVCHTEPCEFAQEDLYPSDGNRDTIPFVEVEGGKSLSPILQNESNSISSDLEHYLVKVEASNSENLTGADDHQASKIAFPGQGESDAVNDPGDSKTGESIPDSFDHMDMAPALSVPCQEDQKMVVSPRNSRTEERLLESSDTFAIKSVKHAEVNMHPLEVDEVIEYPLESQQVSHSRPLASSEACRAANGDLFLSDDIIAEYISPSKGLSTTQSSDESDEYSLLQKIETLNLCNTHFEREQSCQQDDNSTKTKYQPSVPEAAQDSVEAVSRGNIHELDITSRNVANSNQLKTEVDSPLQSSNVVPVSSGNLSASLVSLQAFPSFGTFSTPMVQQQSSELPLDRDPPLPPLPPLQWRMGKLQPSSAFTNGEMTRPETGLSNLTTLPSMDHSDGSLVMGGEVQPSNPFSQVHMYPNDSGQFDYQTLEKDRLNPFQLNAPPPAMEDKKCQDDMLALDEQMKHLHVKDDQQKNELCQEDLSEVPQSLNPFTSLELSDVRSQHFQRVSRGESIEPPNSPPSQLTTVHTQSLHGSAGLENATTHPFNPFLSSTCLEGEHYRYDYGAFGSEMAHLNCTDPSSTAEISPQGFLISQGGNMQTFESVTLPMAEHEKPNGRPRSLLNRPRDPLIEAVASHDKSTLRRVSELVRPSAKPEGERNVLLEQIRNKSFNLKPATVSKPNIKGPPTNLKVAAILERANAIRQAFVGSDEDDDDDDRDSWSDS